MDIWKKCVCILLLLPKHVVDGEYCQAVLQNSSATIVKVCQDNEGTDSIIYLDSAGGPLYHDVDFACTCVLTHYNDTGLQRVYTFIINNDIHGIVFEINNVTFESNSDHKTLDLETGTSIVVQRSSEGTHARTCLVLDASTTTIITVECKAERSDKQLNTKQTVNPTNTLTASTIVQQTSSRQDGYKNTTLEVTNVSDKPNSSLSTEISSADISDKGDGSPTFVIVGGVAGGGVFLIIVIAVLLVMFRQRRKNSGDGNNARENHPRDNIYDSDYYMTTNAHYASADSVRMSPNREGKDAPLQMDTIHDNVEYAVVNKSRVSDTRCRDKPEDENDYNHLYEIKVGVK